MSSANTTVTRSDVIGPDNMLIIPCRPGGKLAEGRYLVLREDGSILLEIHYHYGVPEGLFRDYWMNGQLGSEGYFKNGVPDGIWKYYRADGTTEERQFVNGREVTQYWKPS